MQREIKVGLTVMAAIVLLYLVIAWVNRSSLFAPPEKHYFLSFEQVNGLLQGDPVVVRGYQAGRVVGIRPAASEVSVEIALDENIALFGDAWGEIQIKELMGGKQIALWTGGEGVPLQAGDNITGQTSMDFSTAFSRFGGVMDQFAPESIDRFSRKIDSLGAGFGEVLDPAMLGRILVNLERISTRLDQQTSRLPVERWVVEADTTLKEVQTLLGQSQALLVRLDSVAQRLDAGMLEQGEQLMGSADQSLQRVNTLLGEVEQLMQELKNPATFAGKALYDPAFGARIDSTLWHLNRTLEQIHDQKVIVGFRRK